MRKIRVATMFSGIGAVEFALKRLNVPHEIVFACDNGDRNIEYNVEKELETIRKLPNVEAKKKYVDNLYDSKTRKTNFVKKTYLANYSLSENRFFQDGRLFDGTDFEGQVDLLVGGSPCQSFSSVGQCGGLQDTRGTLFYEFARVVNEIKPKVFIYENVHGLVTHDKGRTWSIIQNVFKSLNYDIHPLEETNAKNFGIPQKRRRLFLIGFIKQVKWQDPKEVELKYTLKDFLIESTEFGGMTYNKMGEIVFSKKPGKIDPKYFLTPALERYVMCTGTGNFYTPVKIDLPVARTLLSTMGNRHRAGVDNYVTVDGKIRMLSEREALRLMGFTDDFILPVSRAQGYKQAGNSIVVDVVMAILKSIMATGIFENSSIITAPKSSLPKSFYDAITVKSSLPPNVE